LFYKLFSVSKNVQELFRKIGTAHGQETAADSSRHYRNVVMFVHAPKSPEGDFYLQSLKIPLFSYTPLEDGGYIKPSLIKSCKCITPKYFLFSITAS